MYCGTLSLLDLINVLAKIFGTSRHQVSSPRIIDPIIVYEEHIDLILLAEFLESYTESNQDLKIIVVLKDNDFERAKKLISQCTHNIYVNFIKNDKKNELFKVISTGAHDIGSFIDYFAGHCFSTCSETTRDVLINEEWYGDSVVKQFAPAMFKIRSSLLMDGKQKILSEVNTLNKELQFTHGKTSGERKLLQSLLCMAKLFRVYCNDAGGTDISDALKIAQEIDDEILLAHVYRYSYFCEKFDDNEKIRLLENAEEIFNRNKISDHALYCRNNILVEQFDTDFVNPREFFDLQVAAINNTPGLVGMSYIYNNAGVSHLLDGNPDESVDCFERGLPYAKRRKIQRFALQSNKLLALDFSYKKIDEGAIRSIISQICLNVEDFAFLTSTMALNCLVVATRQHPGLASDIINSFPIQPLIMNAAAQEIQGKAGSLIQHLQIIAVKYPEIRFENLSLPPPAVTANGIRLKFMMQYGYKPVFFYTWL